MAQSKKYKHTIYCLQTARAHVRMAFAYWSQSDTAGIEDLIENAQAAVCRLEQAVKGRQADEKDADRVRKLVGRPR